MPFISYSQNFEDVMLWRALGHIKNGFYIDVGANSPDEGTVTRAFYERGWHGINVEPNPSLIAALQERRPRDKNLGVAVSAKAGNTILYNFIENTGLATLNESVANAHISNGLTPEFIDAPTQTLTAIWEEHVEPVQPVHFLKVDVEGNEKDVLHSLDWALFRPWIVLVEATYPMSQKEIHKEWESIILDAGYLFAYWDGLNRFYVASEHAELLSSLTAPPNVFDDFVLGKYIEPFAYLQRALKASDEALQNLTPAQKHKAKTDQNYQHEINILKQLLARAVAEQQHSRSSRTERRTEPRNVDVWNHLISVVLFASENNSAGLSKTLASLLGQRYKNIEIIIAGSTLPEDHSLDDFRALRGLRARPDLNVANFLSSELHDKEWRGDYLFFAPAGTVFAASCFEHANCALNEYDHGIPDLAVFDYYLIQANSADSDLVLLPGWDPEFALTTYWYRTAFLTSRKLIKRAISQSAGADLNAWIKLVAKLHPQPEYVHISEPVIYLAEELRAAKTEMARDQLEGRPEANPTVSVIIPNRNRPDLLRSCLKFIENVQEVDIELIIVDNNSDNIETLAIYRSLHDRFGAKILNAGSTFNYSRMINLGVSASESDFIALVNNDVEFNKPGEFESLVQQAMRPEVGIVGTRLLYPSGKIQHAGVVIDTGVLQNAGQEFRCRHVLRGGDIKEDYPLFPQNANRNYLAVTGAVHVMKRQTFNSLGGYDEVYLPIEYNDIDFCLRAKKEGLRVLCVALDGVYHTESESRGREDTPGTLRMRQKAMEVMLSRWGDFVESHPYGHPAIEIGECPEPFLMRPIRV